MNTEPEVARRMRRKRTISIVVSIVILAIAYSMSIGHLVTILQGWAMLFQLPSF